MAADLAMIFFLERKIKRMSSWSSVLGFVILYAAAECWLIGHGGILLAQAQAPSSQPDQATTDPSEGP